MTEPTCRQTALHFEGTDIPVFVALPAQPPRATVVMLGAIWSVTDHIRDLCVRLTAHGLAAIAPCLFRGIGIPARDAAPELLARTFLDFDDVRCVRDLRAVVRHGVRDGFGFTAGPVIPWGFCLGGRFAHYLGAVSEHVAGVVNFYGRIRFDRQPHKPFLPIELAGLIEVPYLGHFAQTDALVPLADVAELDSALAARAQSHAIHVYPGAKHGFFDPTRPPDHDPEASRLAWARTLAFLHQWGAR